jgi:Mg2+-importing ATPase
MEDARRLTALRLLLRQFESPLVLILVFGAVVSLALRQWVDAGIILTIVLGSTLLGSPGFSFTGSSIFDWDSRRD